MLTNKQMITIEIVDWIRGQLRIGNRNLSK